MTTSLPLFFFFFNLALPYDCGVSHNVNTKPTTISRDVRLLSPWFSEKVATAIAECNRAGYPIQTFEGWRSPERQDWLYAQGRTRPGKIITKAKAWQSWHQLGLAQDCAMMINGKWSWDFEAEKIAHFFTDLGLESLAPFEGGHFQMTGGLTLPAALAMVKKSGLQQLWLEVAKK